MRYKKFSITEKDLEAFFMMPEDGWFTKNDWLEKSAVTTPNVRFEKLLEAGLIEIKTHPDREPHSPYRDAKFRKIYRKFNWQDSQE